MTAGRAALGIAAAVAGTAALLALSHVPYSAGAADAAAIHLAWRVRGVRVEQCRRPTPAELAAVPAHMRRTEICEGRLLPYALTVTLDGDTVVLDTVRAAGAREDRPLYVNRAVRVDPGIHHLVVQFVREALPAADTAGDVTPAGLTLDAALRLRAGEVALVTYDADRRRLTGRGYGFIDSSSRTPDSLFPPRR